MNEIEKSTAEKIEKQLEPIFNLMPKNCTDININPDGRTFFSTQDNKTTEANQVINSDILLSAVTMLAGLCSKNLNSSSPFLSAVLPLRHYRLEVLIPPAVSSVCISVRIQSEQKINLDALIEKKMMSNEQANKLQFLVKNKKNIIISGETGSGKTTLLNALLNLVENDERLIIIEEFTKEIYVSKTNIVSIVTDREGFNGRMAVMSALRMNPDRIIYGESRDGESALETLKAWRTGHSGGLTTIHTSSADNIKKRLSDLLMEVCSNPMTELIDDTVDAGVHIGFENGLRKILEIKLFK